MAKFKSWSSFDGPAAYCVTLLLDKRGREEKMIVYERETGVEPRKPVLQGSL